MPNLNFFFQANTCTIVNPGNIVINADPGDPVTITLTATQGATFPAGPPQSNYFSWKTNPPPPVTVSYSSTQLTLSYTMPSAPVTWKYGIKLQGGSNNCASTSLDPEIDNQPPPRPKPGPPPPPPPPPGTGTGGGGQPGGGGQKPQQ